MDKIFLRKGFLLNNSSSIRMLKLVVLAIKPTQDLSPPSMETWVLFSCNHLSKYFLRILYTVKLTRLLLREGVGFLLPACQVLSQALNSRLVPEKDLIIDMRIFSFIVFFVFLFIIFIYTPVVIFIILLLLFYSHLYCRS